MSELVAHLEHEGRALSQRVLAEMYRDAFWSERFGDKGRRHANEDSDFHLRYLARALAAGDAGILARYATWLREVLATRGMCTRHLDENFRLLAREIAAQPWPDRDWAAALLAQARDALVYPAGAARWVQEHAERIAAAAIQGAQGQGRGAWKKDDGRGDAGLPDDARNYVSYLADALALGDARTLVEHTRWFVRHLHAHGAAAPAIEGFVAGIAGALEAQDAPRPALEYLRAARHETQATA